MVAIVIVGYNSKKYLKDCFISIKKSTHKNYKIIFVDNASTDDSTDYIKKKYPGVILIKNKQNFGFAKGNNIGIKRAISLDAKYVFLLNPDTIIKKDCLKILMSHADQNTILQPLILLHSHGRKTNLINTSGNVLHYLGFSWCGDYKEPALKFKNVAEKEIAGASGAGMLLPIKIYQSIGGFDETFFMYYEDMDLSWRARMAGYNIGLIPDARVWHDYHFSRNKNKMYYIELNRLRFLFKNYRMKTLFLILPALFVNEISILIYALLKGWLLIKLKSYLIFIITLPDPAKKRYQIKKIINDSKLKKYLSYRPYFSEVSSYLFQPYNLFLKTYWKLINELI